MSFKRWLLATIGAFIVLMAGDYVIHQLWLGDVYRAHPTWWRPAEQMAASVNLLLTSELVLAMLLALVYTKGYQAGAGGIWQGFRFGVLIGLLLFLPSSLMDLFVYPYPVTLVASWMAGGVVEVTLAGMVIGSIYKPGK